MARMNISTGPMTQFCTNESPSTRQFRKTSTSSSYFTLASGGYIIRIRPMAIGMLVVPTWNRSMNAGTPDAKYPSPTPVAMARKIQAVRYRSRNDRFLTRELFNPGARFCKSCRPS